MRLQPAPTRCGTQLPWAWRSEFCLADLTEWQTGTQRVGARVARALCRGCRRGCLTSCRTPTKRASSASASWKVSQKVWPHQAHRNGGAHPLCASVSLLRRHGAAVPLTAAFKALHGRPRRWAAATTTTPPRWCVVRLPSSWPTSDSQLLLRLRHAQGLAVYSMEMAGITCFDGRSTSSRWRGALSSAWAAELDTDGIWCILPRPSPRISPSSSLTARPW